MLMIAAGESLMYTRHLKPNTLHVVSARKPGDRARIFETQVTKVELIF